MPFYQIFADDQQKPVEATGAAKDIISSIKKSDPYDRDNTFLHELKKEKKPGQVLVDKASDPKVTKTSVIIIKASDISGNTDKQKILGKKATFTLSVAAAEAIKQGARVYLSDKLPPKFYLALTEALSKYTTEQKMSDVMYQSLKNLAANDKDIAALLVKAQQNFAGYGFKNIEAFEQLLTPPLTHVIALNVVLTQPSVVILNSKNQISEKTIAYVVSSASGLDLQTKELYAYFFEKGRVDPNNPNSPKDKIIFKEDVETKDKGLKKEQELKKAFKQILSTELDALQMQGIDHVSMIPRGLGAFLELFKMDPINQQTLDRIHKLYMEAVFEVAIDKRYSNMNLLFNYKPIPRTTVESVTKEFEEKHVQQLINRSGVFAIHDKDAGEIAEHLASAGAKVALQNASDSKALVNNDDNVMGMHWKSVRPKEKKSPGNAPVIGSSIYVAEEKYYASKSLPLRSKTLFRDPKTIITSTSSVSRCTNDLITTMTIINGGTPLVNTAAPLPLWTDSDKSQLASPHIQTAPAVSSPIIQTQAGILRESAPVDSAAAPGRPRSVAIPEIPSQAKKIKLAQQFAEKNPVLAETINRVVTIIGSPLKTESDKLAISKINNYLRIGTAGLESEGLTGLKEYYIHALSNVNSLAAAAKSAPPSPRSSTSATPVLPLSEARIAQNTPPITNDNDKAVKIFQQAKSAAAWRSTHIDAANKIDATLNNPVSQNTQSIRNLKVQFHNDPDTNNYIDYKYAKLQEEQLKRSQKNQQEQNPPHQTL